MEKSGMTGHNTGSWVQRWVDPTGSQAWQPNQNGKGAGSVKDPASKTLMWKVIEKHVLRSTSSRHTFTYTHMNLPHACARTHAHPF